MKLPGPAIHLALEAGAVVASAVSGMISASRARLDLVGTFMLAVTVAFGGGTLRDVLLGRRPFFWVANTEYLLVALVLTVCFVYSRRLFAFAIWLDGRATLVDAFGLALFSLTGVGFALEQGLPPLPASLIGVITGTFGGVIRDLLVQEVPTIFRPGPLYAIPAFAGCWVFLAGAALHLPPPASEAAGFVTIVGLRMASVIWGVRIPDPHWIRDRKS